MVLCGSLALQEGLGSCLWTVLCVCICVSTITNPHIFSPHACMSASAIGKYLLSVYEVLDALC